MMKLSLILSAILIGLWQSADVAEAVCAKPTTLANFDYLKFNGTWYAIQHIPNIFEHGLRCQQTTDNADTKTKGHYRVQDAGIRETTHSVVTSDSTLETPNQAHPGLLENVGPGGLIRLPFYVIDTDYENYAFTYTCASTPLGLISVESAWILSRKRTLDSKIVDKGLAVFKDLKVDLKKFVVTKQTDCELLDKHK